MLETCDDLVYHTSPYPSMAQDRMRNSPHRDAGCTVAALSTCPLLQIRQQLLMLLIVSADSIDDDVVSELVLREIRHFGIDVDVV